jgi:hypothetical protein
MAKKIAHGRKTEFGQGLGPAGTYAGKVLEGAVESDALRTAGAGRGLPFFEESGIIFQNLWFGGVPARRPRRSVWPIVAPSVTKA